MPKHEPCGSHISKTTKIVRTVKSLIRVTRFIHNHVDPETLNSLLAYLDNILTTLS